MGEITIAPVVSDESLRLGDWCVWTFGGVRRVGRLASQLDDVWLLAIPGTVGRWMAPPDEVRRATPTEIQAAQLSQLTGGGL
jgi:hypothetical protein